MYQQPNCNKANPPHNELINPSVAPLASLRQAVGGPGNYTLNTGVFRTVGVAAQHFRQKKVNY